MYLNEIFRGRYVPAPPVTEFPNVEQLNELMIVGPITVRSACSHHLCPIMGKVWVGIMPNEHSNLIGLSKYARLTEWVMSRPQIQEEAVTQLSSLLYDMMQPDGLALVMEGCGARPIGFMTGRLRSAFNLSSPKLDYLFPGPGWSSHTPAAGAARPAAPCPTGFRRAR